MTTDSTSPSKPAPAPGAKAGAGQKDDCLSDNGVTATEATKDVDLPEANGGVAPAR